MSTRITIKHRQVGLNKPGYHLFEDVFEVSDQEDGGQEAPVYLELDRVDVMDLSTTYGGAVLTLCLPRELAMELGILPKPTPESDGPIETSEREAAS